MYLNYKRYSIFIRIIVFGRFGWPGWTGWEVLTVLDEWKMALVTVLVEVERVKMVGHC